VNDIYAEAPGTAHSGCDPALNSPFEVNLMRFGLFVSQGWRLDLAGITPAEHWATMLEIVRAADAGLFDSVRVYDHLHTVPVPTQEATHAITRSANYNVTIGETERDVAEKLEWIRAHLSKYVPPDVVMTAPACGSSQ
jgi:hypothetical protein